MAEKSNFLNRLLRKKNIDLTPNTQRQADKVHEKKPYWRETEAGKSYRLQQESLAHNRQELKKAMYEAVQDTNTSQMEEILNSAITNIGWSGVAEAYSTTIGNIANEAIKQGREIPYRKFVDMKNVIESAKGDKGKDNFEKSLEDIKEHSVNGFMIQQIQKTEDLQHQIKVAHFKTQIMDFISKDTEECSFDRRFDNSLSCDALKHDSKALIAAYSEILKDTGIGEELANIDISEANPRRLKDIEQFMQKKENRNLIYSIGLAKDAVIADDIPLNKNEYVSLDVNLHKISNELAKIMDIQGLLYDQHEVYENMNAYIANIPRSIDNRQPFHPGFTQVEINKEDISRLDWNYDFDVIADAYIKIAENIKREMMLGIGLIDEKQRSLIDRDMIAIADVCQFREDTYQKKFEILTQDSKEAFRTIKDYTNMADISTAIESYCQGYGNLNSLRLLKAVSATDEFARAFNYKMSDASKLKQERLLNALKDPEIGTKDVIEAISHIADTRYAQKINIMLTKEENSMEIDEHTTYPAKTEERE